MYNIRQSKSRIYWFLLACVIVSVSSIGSLGLQPRLALSAGVVNLTWEINDPTEVISSKIYRSTTQHFEQPSQADFLAEVLAPTSTYQDATATAGQTYYYSIFEFDSDGTYFDPSYFISEATDTGSPSTPPASTPSTPPTTPSEPGQGLQMPTGLQQLLQAPAPGEQTPEIPRSTYDGYPVGTLVQAGRTIYLVTEPYVMVGFTNLNAFKALGYSLRHVIKGSTNGYSISKRYFVSSTTQSHPWSAWVINEGTVYYVSRDGLIPVPSYDIFLNNGGQGKFILKAMPADLEILRDNSPLPPLEANDVRIVR